jgi:hypothetical protein
VPFCHNHHHYHHLLLSLRGHRAPTKRHHLILFLASFLTSPPLFPSSSASLWTDLLHNCLGLPLFCFPCGFQSKASLSMASFPFLSVSNSISAFLFAWISQFPQSSSRVPHLRSLLASGYSEFFISSDL